MKLTKPYPRIFLFDLETSGLDANRAHIMCAAGKWLGEKEIKSWRIDAKKEYGTTPRSWHNDSWIVKDLVELADSADAVVAYYGGYGKFDVPYLNTRALAHQLMPCKQLSIVDPYTIAKGKLKLARNSMDSVAALLGCKHQKQHLPWADWHHARYGDRKAMDRLVSYCKNDVVVLEEIYLTLLPLMHTHPFTDPSKSHDPNNCPVCGGKSQSKGNRWTKCFKIKTRQCRKCGKRFDTKREKVA